MVRAIAVAICDVFDVLKPHQANGSEFASQLADIDVSVLFNLLLERWMTKSLSTTLSISGQRSDDDQD